MAARAFPKERSGALGRSHPSKVGRWLAASIVDTIREPLLILDRNLRVVTANRSFYVTTKMDRDDIQGLSIEALGDGQWNIPELRLLLEKVVTQHTAMEGYEVKQDFSGIGRRTIRRGL